MAIGITVTPENLENLSVIVTLTGLNTSTLYDVYRLQMRYLGHDEDDERVYERETPDRPACWSAVGHRIAWQPTSTTETFRDYETPTRPTKYFLVETDAIGPFEYDFSDGDYPVSRGVLDDEVVHLNQDITEADAEIGAEPMTGDILVRSTDELAHFAECCLVEMDGPKYIARGTEHVIMGSQYPVYIADSREARRGSVTLLTRDLGEYNDLRRCVFPPSGRIRPVLLQGGGDPSLLLDDMKVIPLDIEIEQATHHDADWRYVTIDYVEINPASPLTVRPGTGSGAPHASFTVSPNPAHHREFATVTSTSTGTYQKAEWYIGHPTMNNRVGHYYTEGPHRRIMWPYRGFKRVKLRIWGSAGASSCSKRIKVN